MVKSFFINKSESKAQSLPGSLIIILSKKTIGKRVKMETSQLSFLPLKCKIKGGVEYRNVGLNDA